MARMSNRISSNGVKRKAISILIQLKMSNKYDERRVYINMGDLLDLLQIRKVLSNLEQHKRIMGKKLNIFLPKPGT